MMSQHTDKRGVFFGAYIEAQSANRLEIDRIEKDINSKTEQLEKMIDFYLSKESLTETERRRYQEKIITAKCKTLNNAMREENKRDVFENVIELLVRFFLYKRLNFNKSRLKEYHSELITVLNYVNIHDKILFEEIMDIIKVFGIKTNKYRSLCAEKVKIKNGALEYSNNTISNIQKMQDEMHEQDQKFMFNMGLKK